MNAAAPEGVPPPRINDFKITKKFPAPPCLGEALRRGTLTCIQTFFHNSGENHVGLFL